jgi:FKBP12-rapamycin complex-associated protein
LIARIHLDDQEISKQNMRNSTNDDDANANDDDDDDDNEEQQSKNSRNSSSSSSDGGGRPLISELLYRVGSVDPQSLVFALTVAASPSSSGPDDKQEDESLMTPRCRVAHIVLMRLRGKYASLCDQASKVSKECIRVAILWHELWHEALNTACHQYFVEKDVEAMLNTLEPLHKQIEEAEARSHQEIDTLSISSSTKSSSSLSSSSLSMREISFIHCFGRDLRAARKWCIEYQKSKNVADINQAWQLYYRVFKDIQKQLPQMTTVHLRSSSPWLFSARDLELTIPGERSNNINTIDDNDEIFSHGVHIRKFSPSKEKH